MAWGDGPFWSNWAGTADARPQLFASPASVAQLQTVVREAAARGLRVKALGSGHSFTPIAVTDGVAVRLGRLTGILRADIEAGLVTVLAGTTLHELGERLWALGLAMENLGDIDGQTVAGAISTGTHGTGARFGGLATQVRGLRLVLADGTLLDCSAEQNPDVFAAARIGLGALGVIATVTLQCVPAFLLHATEAPGLLGDVLDGFDELAAANDHAEFYWFPHTRRVLTKRNNHSRGPARPLGRLRRAIDDEFLSNTVFEWTNRLCAARPSMIPRVNALAARALSAREYVDRSYRVFASPRRVVFREMEYAVPRKAARHVLTEIDGWLRRSGEHIAFPVEVRVTAADDVWLSTAYQRDSAYIAVHQHVRRDHRAYFDAVEQIARSVGGRPHWGKLHSLDAARLRETYPRFDDFVAVRDRLDPDRRFANLHLRQILGP
ncbi:D-arabinono-1,4-lactone oxidase [Pseudonocardia acidicola]|uniref:D-arabinono-1,4-lactone oxidase n=1 Tax=Pseudonocardia acidicola TaxID=2724939 RepID=UPI0030846D7A